MSWEIPVLILYFVTIGLVFKMDELEKKLEGARLSIMMLEKEDK